ncbi:WxL domain-containing protein [Enterococcus entomosocium]|uniref:WxL domain-containing protein n=4 Tax=Enterococcus TaxID=1350 RepID=UPI0026477388|nr:WxL domain-containing protein [Enterococcus entomosocium]
MATRFRRPLLMLGTTILIMQAIFMPVGMVYAETTMDTEEKEQVELPLMKNYLEEEQISDPRFFFTRSRMQATAGEPFQVTFFSDREVSEARVFLPEEATLLKDQLSTGISVEEGDQPREWIIQSKRAQNTFVLPLVIEKVGNYELAVEETTAHLEISNQEEMREEVPVEETESSEDLSVGQEELEENEIAEKENQQPTEEVSDPVSEAPQEQQTDEEKTDEEKNDEASKVVEPTVFDGEVAEVSTVVQFKEAVANPEIGIISVQANLSGYAANILRVDRPLFIQGNGYTLTFGHNGFYFQLEDVEEESTLRIENATLAKVGLTPLLNSSVAASSKWTVELEAIREVNDYTMRLAVVPEGTIVFTGGVSNFTRTDSTRVFIQAKEVQAINQAQVTISRGNATIFSSPATVSNPKLIVDNGAVINIATAAGTANTIDFRGENSEIMLLGAGELTVNTRGTATAPTPTDTLNNTIALTGQSPKLAISGESRLSVQSTLSKRGIHLAGSNPQVLVEDSELTVVSATQATLNLTGENPRFSAENSTLQLRTTTGQRLNLVGAEPIVTLESSQLSMHGSTGQGILLQGVTPQLLLNASELSVSDTGASLTTTGALQAIILSGTDALVSLSDQSEVNLNFRYSGTGTSENIQIGDNNARPELSVTGRSKLSVTTNSGTIGANDTRNNVLHLHGSDPKATIEGNSELAITVISNERRGMYLNGNNAELTILDSQLSLRTVSGQTLNLTGISPKITMNKSQLALRSTTGQRMNLIGSNPVLNLENSQLDMKATTGRGIYLQGATPQVLMENSQLLMTDTGASQGMILQGTDALLSLSNKSELSIIGAGTGTAENIQIGNNNARPELLVAAESKVSVTTTSGTGAATDTANNAIHLRGADPKTTVIGGSELVVSITSNARRGVYLNGDNANLSVTDSLFDVTTVSGQTLNLTGTSPKITLKKSSARIVSTTGQRMNVIGSNPVLNLENSQLDMKTATGRGIYLQGATPQVLMENSQLLMTDTGASQGMILQGTDALLSLSNQSELAITGAGTGTAENIQIGNNNARPELSVTGESKVTVTTTSGTGAAKDTENNAIHLRGADPKAIFNDAELNIEIISGSRRGLYLNGDNSDLRILDSKIDIETLRDTGLRTFGNNGTNFISNSQIDLLSGTSVAIGFTGNSMKTTIANNSKIVSDQGMYFAGQEITVENNSEIEIIQTSETSVATISDQRSIYGVLTFERRGSTKGQLTINHSGLSIDQKDRQRYRAPLNIVGGNNELLVENGGSLNIVNEGDGQPNDSTFANANAGVGFRNYESNTTIISNNDFIVRDPGSRIEIQANYGAAVTMSTNRTLFDGSVTVENQGYFVATGNTAGNTSGVFVGSLVHVTFDNPLFLDFTNYRTGGGQVFGVSNANSTFTGINSDLALWENNSDLSGDPLLNFKKLDYAFRGVNYNTLVSSSDPEQLNTDTLGTTGLLPYTRISSNNGRWAIADELRVPTNADKKIHGRVSLPVGLDDSRPAWDDEVIVTVEVKSPSGKTQDYTTKTVGHSDKSPGISIYGEEPRGGLFEINLDEPLEAGSKVRIIKVELSSGELSEGFEHQILTDTVKVFPIVPPTPAQFSSSIIAQDSTTIQGTTDTLDAEVTATHNGKPINTENITIDSEGRFTLDVSNISLEIDDKIQVFLRDDEGSAQEAGIINPPETNNTRGNINPATELTFHDATFEPATTLIIGDVGPVSPVDPLYPEFEVDPENKPELPEDQGQLSIDFISSFNFGSQAISVHDQTYYAQPQRLLNEDGTVNESEERPNYVQVSDRRSENERNGWTLAVTQKEQFKGEENQVLNGASLSLSNQQVITAQGGKAPSLQSIPCELVPGNRRTLLKAQGSEGTGTWIYRFGDDKTAGTSVSLNVPKGTNPEATTYQTTLTWELSAVPDN